MKCSSHKHRLGNLQTRKQITFSIVVCPNNLHVSRCRHGAPDLTFGVKRWQTHVCHAISSCSLSWLNSSLQVPIMSLSRPYHVPISWVVTCCLWMPLCIKDNQSALYWLIFLDAFWFPTVSSCKKKTGLQTFSNNLNITITCQATHVWGQPVGQCLGCRSMASGTRTG